MQVPLDEGAEVVFGDKYLAKFVLQAEPDAAAAPSAEEATAA